MSEIKDGGPAFARAAGDYNGTKSGNGAQNGMTLRDYFAAQMLALWDTGMSVCDQTMMYDRFATHCYRMADAMIRARGQS